MQVCVLDVRRRDQRTRQSSSIVTNSWANSGVLAVPATECRVNQVARLVQPVLLGRLGKSFHSKNE